MKGINYFGFETNYFAPHGLEIQSLDFLLDFVANNDFNAIRLPFSIEMIKINPETTSIDCDKNPGICRLKSMDLMEAVIDRLVHFMSHNLLCTGRV